MTECTEMEERPEPREEPECSERGHSESTDLGPG